MFNSAAELKALSPWKKRKTVVFMSDFGNADGAVSAMHGVSDSVCRDLRLEDLTHEIPQFNIWEASYRLIQALTYWAPGTVFVCVVDPGVGSDRESTAVLTASGHIIVTPDNGTLSHVAKKIGILERRLIQEDLNRLKDSQRSFTFYGRDVYAYTGARLAAGQLDFEDVGQVLSTDPVMLNIEDAREENGKLFGTIDVLDTRYGSLWTNIPDTLFFSSGIKYGDRVYVTVFHKDRVAFGGPMKVCRNFTEVESGEKLVYINSLLNVSVALNMESFARRYSIGSGENWKITVEKL